MSADIRSKQRFDNFVRAYTELQGVHNRDEVL